MKRFFITDERGVTGIEFAFVALPIAIMLIGMAEMSLMFAAGSALHGATEVAARQIRTGAVQTSGDPQQTFDNLLCEHVDTYISCEELMYEVIDMPDGSFSTASNYQPDFDEEGELQAVGFSPGVENDVVLIRVAYRYPIKTPLFQPLLSDLPGNRKLLMTTVVLQNEPYNF